MRIELSWQQVNRLELIQYALKLGVVGQKRPWRRTHQVRLETIPDRTAAQTAWAVLRLNTLRVLLENRL